MTQEWTIAGDYSVEIWFRIVKDAEGYPATKDWEQLLARPLLEREDYFQIESIPFYLKDVSAGDIVKAKTSHNEDDNDQEFFEFDTVIDRGGHNTYRLLIRNKRAGDPLTTERELTDKGLAVELEDDNFLAVDVPPALDQQMIDEYLVAQSNQGRWEMQDGYLHSVRTVSGRKPS